MPIRSPSIHSRVPGDPLPQPPNHKRLADYHPSADFNQLNAFPVVGLYPAPSLRAQAGDEEAVEAREARDATLAAPKLLFQSVQVNVDAGRLPKAHANGKRYLNVPLNLFGPTDELGLFEMAEQGLVGVPDASRLFLADRRTGVAGSAVLPTLDGQRPMLVEVQALATSTSAGGSPRRSAQGIDPGRLALLLAVLERRARVVAAGLEIYASAAGGVRLAEPGADLAISLAVASAITNQPLPPDLVVFGEVGLAGEVRQVSHARRRLTEAGRLGFRRAIVPANSPNGIDGVQLLRVSTVTEALATAGLTAP